ncbi:MAG TPA: UDP-2,4-diacetamido-2,4,6-trideoxy-beta-L-altropyranose hydrolase [Terracidiphilus sp.]
MIRADASAQLGTGHMMRCLTLAHALKQEGASVAFVSREMPAALERLVSKNFSLHWLKACTGTERSLASEEDALETVQYVNYLGKPDWIVIDNYSIGLDWERQVRPHVKRIMVIDDLANRAHDCDVLLDQNLSPNFEIRYDALVPTDALKLLGPRYALLRSEFYEARNRLRVRDGHIRSILISFGGSDPSNETTKALRAMLLLGPSGIDLEVVLGGSNRQVEAVSNLCSQFAHARLLHDVSNMADLMAKADLAIGAPGTTTWERCLLGLPAIAIVLAPNQQLVGEGMGSAGAIVNLGWHSDVTSVKIAEAVAQLRDNPQTVLEMGLAGLRVMQDNNGVARQQILGAILNWKEQGHGQSI